MTGRSNDREGCDPTLLVEVEDVNALDLLLTDAARRNRRPKLLALCTPSHRYQAKPTRSYFKPCGRASDGWRNGVVTARTQRCDRLKEGHRQIVPGAPAPLLCLVRFSHFGLADRNFHTDELSAEDGA